MSQEWTTGYVSSGEIKLHYYRTGGAKPPLLLAHGFSDDGLCWVRLAKLLEVGYDIIMMDARGHGLSSAPESDYTYAHQAADFAALVEALRLEKPALLGHSMGAFAAAATAAAYPDMLSCLLLEDPPWLESADAVSPRLMQEMADSWQADIIKTKEKSVNAAIAEGKKEHPTWHESEWLPWAIAKQQMSVNCFKMIAEERPSWQEMVARITVPILLLTGDVTAGALVTNEVAAMASEKWHQGRIAHCPGAGHSIRREQFDCYAQHVARFLNDYYE